MYQLCLRREFEAKHFLIGGDWGPENELHAHPYRLEWILEGSQLDAHGYLVDLLDVESHLEAVLSRYRGKVLNDDPEFSGLNPSLEHFCRILARQLAARLRAADLQAHTVRLWENEAAWAAWRQEL